MTSSSHWNNVIVGELVGREFTPTVLTVVAIPGVNVASRELHLVMMSLHFHIA